MSGDGRIAEANRNIIADLRKSATDQRALVLVWETHLERFNQQLRVKDATRPEVEVIEMLIKFAETEKAVCETNAAAWSRRAEHLSKYR